MKITRDFIHRMPKTDLHVHLDGSMRLSTILELAEKEGIALPGNPQTEDELARAINIGAICEDLTDYLKAFDVTLSVMQTEESLYRAAFELGEDAARENVKYMEVRYSPLLHTRNGLSYPVIVEAVAEGLREAKRRYGLMSGQIICGIRHMTPESSLRMAELCVAFKNRGVVGFDLAGAEADNPAKDYREAFYLIRNNNVNLTIHAGEAYGPESIHQAIHLGGAHRIGHGTRLREDGDLLNFLNDHRIPLEVCLTSNVQTRAAKSFESHPLPFYMSYGLRCTINTDNRLITDTTMTDEFWRAVQHYDLNIGDLRKLMIDGFKSAFMPYRKKRTVTAQACAEFDALVRDFETSSGEKATTDPRVAQEIAFQKASADARTPLIYHIQPEDRRPEASDADVDVDSDKEQPSPAE
ncbi:adenosine deaminase [Lujinxingia vulgaris]|uniref:adenosine deaminase n=1 Tax=Lujinxingia vulgaris TaxID=2600176 RepID=UPI001E59AAF3|nr:adenosine deaminase [Lujinxingia vulgaris]